VPPLDTAGAGIKLRSRAAVPIQNLGVGTSRLRCGLSISRAISKTEHLNECVTCILNGNCSHGRFRSCEKSSRFLCCVPGRACTRVLVSELLRAKRLEFFSAGLTEVTQNIDGIAVDHLL
jgi:hypothetical protein